MEGEGSGGGPEGEGEGVFTKILDAPCRSKLIVTSCACSNCIRLACMRRQGSYLHPYLYSTEAVIFEGSILIAGPCRARPLA